MTDITTDTREADTAALTRQLNRRVLLGISPFAGLIPFFNIILPLILHLCWKDRDEQLKRIGEVILNTQITLTLAAFLVYALHLFMSLFAPLTAGIVANNSPGLAVGAQLLSVGTSLLWSAYLFAAWAVSAWQFIQVCNNRDAAPRSPFFVIRFFN